jgi:putative ATP-binding cassette transporter
MEQVPTESTSGIVTAEAGDRLAFEDLTLKSAGGERTLVNQLSATIDSSSRLAVIGRNEPAQMALFQASAGLWERGHGRIFKPPPDNIIFLSQTPYVIPGSLRDQFISIGPAARDDRRVMTALTAVGLNTLVAEVGGLDVEGDWPRHLTTGQQQALAVARVLLAQPRFAVLDRVSWTLSPSAYRNFIHCLSDIGTGLVVFTGQDETPDCCERILELKPDGSWSLENTTRSRSPAEKGEDGSVDLYSTGQEPVTH